MKTAKLIIGIISIVLTFLVLFQSCAAGICDALMEEGGTSGSAGLFVAILMFIAGIVAIATRSSRGGGIFCTIVYGIAGLIGILMHGIFQDLIIWGALCLIFAVIFLLSVLKMKGKTTNDTSRSDNN